MPISSLNASEAGLVATYELQLTQPPTADVSVRVYLSSSDQTQAHLGETAAAAAAGSYVDVNVAIPASRWSVPVQIIVAAVDDYLVEGGHSVAVRHTVTSQDSEYNGIDIPGVRTYIEDDDTDVNITFTPSQFTVTEGSYANFTITLTGAIPEGETVTVTLAATDASHIAFNPTTFTFSGSSAIEAQEAWVYATDNFFVDYDRTTTLSVTASSAIQPYNDLGTLLSYGTIVDNDVGADGLQLGADLVAARRRERRRGLLQGQGKPPKEFEARGSAATAHATEAHSHHRDHYSQAEAWAVESILTEGDGVAWRFGAALTAKPQSLVTISFWQVEDANSTIPLERQQLVMTPPSLSFTPTEWQTMKEVEIQALADTIAEGTHIIYVLGQTFSEDAFFDGRYTADLLNLTVLEDPEQKDPLIINPQEVQSAVVQEGSTSSFFAGGLRSQPLHPVRLEEYLLSEEERQALARLEYTAVVPFSMEAHYLPVTLSFSSVDDRVQYEDYTVDFEYITRSNDSYYNNLTVLPLRLTFLDNDMAGVTVAPLAMQLVGNNSMTVDVSLDSEPQGGSFVMVTPQPSSIDLLVTETDTGSGTLNFTAGTSRLSAQVTYLGSVAAATSIIESISWQVSSEDPFYDRLSPAVVANVTVTIHPEINNTGNPCNTPRWCTEVPSATWEQVGSTLHCTESYPPGMAVPDRSQYIVEAYLRLVPGSDELSSAAKRVCGVPINGTSPDEYVILGSSKTGGNWTVQDYVGPFLADSSEVRMHQVDPVADQCQVCITDSSDVELFALATRRAPVIIIPVDRVIPTFRASAKEVLIDPGILVEEDGVDVEIEVTHAVLTITSCDPTQDRLGLANPSMQQNMSELNYTIMLVGYNSSSEQCIYHLMAADNGTIDSSDRLEAALREVTYENGDSDRTGGLREILLNVEVVYTSESGDTNYTGMVDSERTLSVFIEELNRAPVITISEDPPALYITENQAKFLDSGIMVEDWDRDWLYGAEVDLPCYDSDMLYLDTSRTWEEEAELSMTTRARLANVTALVDTTCPVAQAPTWCRDASQVNQDALVDCPPCNCKLVLSGFANAATYQVLLRRVTLSIPGPRVVYHTRTATFIASDAYSTSTPATRSVVVTPVNDAPVILDQAVIGAVEDGPAVVGEMRAEDPEGGVLWYTVICEPSKGSLEVLNANTGAVTYTPDLDQIGRDSFIFQAYDGELNSPLGTVQIEIAPVNDPPTAFNSSLTVLENRT
eukprot:gene9534-11298_t